MADRGRRGDAVFFIYDHNMLKKEEDDLKDAILFFTPDSYSIEDQCALCGQLMGVSEFLKATLSKSAPRVFRFEHDKFALKRTGAYTFGLKGSSFTPDSLLNTQLTALYETFITYHGSVDSLKLRCKESSGAFLQELSNIWKIILNVSKVFYGHALSQTFQALPYIQLPKSGTHLFLQASHLLQSSQRRPCVLAGTILYKNRVLSTQLPPKLTNHLTYLQNQIPHIVRKTDCDLPVGCRIITVFLTDEELSEIAPLDSLARHHCKMTDFSVCRQSDNTDKQSTKSSKQSKNLTRRLTCPNLSVSNSVSQKALHSYLASGQRNSYLSKQESVTVDNFSWSRKSKLSLSQVPIVECKNGESPTVTDVEVLYERAEQSHFGESYKQVATTADCDNEQSETDSESDDVIVPAHEDDTENQRVPHAQVPVVSNITQTHSEDTDEILKSNGSGSTIKKNLEVNDLFQSKTEKHTEMEGKKSEHLLVNEISEHIDLCDAADSRNQGVAVREKSDTEQNENKLLNNEKENIPKLTEKKKTTVENPSISDLDDDEDEEIGITVKDVKHSNKESSIILDSKGTESPSALVEHRIEDKISSTVSSETSVEISKETNLTGIALSNSSSEGVKSRFYDCLSDTDTKTLKKDSNHTVHQHVVDVHLQDSGAKSEIEHVENEIENNERSKTEVTSTFQSETSSDLTQNEKVAENVPTNVENTLPNILLQKNLPPNTSVAQSQDDCKNITNSEEKQFKRQESESSQPFDVGEGGKENVDPNASFLSGVLSDAHRYESEIETEDEGITIATIEPCINCLEQASKQPGHSAIVRCSHCIEQFNKRRMFPRFGNDQEVIDFHDRGRERYESGTETEADIERRGSGQAASVLSSLSSDVSTDSTISRYWTHEMDGLNDVTLYVQCHSDISLLLVMENPEQYEESLFHSLWKGSLAHLADLDFYLKECTETSDDEDSENTYRYLKYDMFAADLKGTIEDPGIDRKSNNLHQMLASLHTEFQQEECLSDAILRSHFNSCYGHSNHVEETYFQADLQQKLSSGFPIPRDPVFSLDMLAQQHLANEKHLSLL